MTSWKELIEKHSSAKQLEWATKMSTYLNADRPIKQGELKQLGRVPWEESASTLEPLLLMAIEALEKVANGQFTPNKPWAVEHTQETLAKLREELERR